MMLVLFFLFFSNDTATTEIYTLSLHDALPISDSASKGHRVCRSTGFGLAGEAWQSQSDLRAWPAPNRGALQRSDGRCCEGRDRSGWRRNQDQENRSLMARD